MSTLYRCTVVIFHVRNKTITITTDALYICRCVCILCNMLQFNIINVIYVKDSNHFYF